MTTDEIEKRLSEIDSGLRCSCGQRDCPVINDEHNPSDVNWLLSLARLQQSKMETMREALAEIESDEDCNVHPCPRVASRALEACDKELK